MKRKGGKNVKQQHWKKDFQICDRSVTVTRVQMIKDALEILKYIYIYIIFNIKSILGTKVFCLIKADSQQDLHHKSPLSKNTPLISLQGYVGILKKKQKKLKCTFLPLTQMSSAKTCLVTDIHFCNFVLEPRRSFRGLHNGVDFKKKIFFL